LLALPVPALPALLAVRAVFPSLWPMVFPPSPAYSRRSPSFLLLIDIPVNSNSSAM
jgi:hypothetical protein